MARPSARMQEILELYFAGYSESDIKNMMHITDERIWYQYKRRFKKFLLNSVVAENSKESQENNPESMPDGYAPVNPLMYDKNLGTDQNIVINELVKAKKLDKLRSYELKRLFKPIGDDRFTRKALEILSSKCRDLNLPWQTSIDLGWKLRRKISRRFDKNVAEQLADEVLNQYVSGNAR